MLAFYLSLIDDEADRSKFERIYYSYRNLMYYTAYNVLHNNSDAEDIVQAAFLKIAENISKIDEKKCHKTTSYIVIITERLAINLYNKNRKQKIICLDDVIETDLEWIDTPINAENEVLLDKVKHLPANYSTVLVLKYVHGFNCKEISETLNISCSTVRKRLERGVKMLRGRINE